VPLEQGFGPRICLTGPDVSFNGMRLGSGAVTGLVLLVTACGAGILPIAASKPTASPAYVRWLPLAETGVFPAAPDQTPGPPVPIPAGTPACTATRLEARAGFGGAATGHTDMPVIVRNRSSSLCFVEGYPDVTIYDAAGRVLVQSSGTQNRGTFFDATPAIMPILMQTGTAPMPGFHEPAVPGQAYLIIEWWDCRGATASRIAIGLPGGAGTLTADYPVRSGCSAGCDSGVVAPSGVFRGQFTPTAIQWPPSPVYQSNHITIESPTSVKRGSTLVYFVTVTNTSVADYKLDPCPDYIEILGPKQAVARYRLNCGPVGHIAPGSSVKFEMRLAVPASIASGPEHLIWTLADGRLGAPFALATVSVT
jgi:hypothetical protein